MPTWTKQNKSHTATYRAGGEMWMGGPEWGYLSIDGHEEIIGATPDDIVWSDDGQIAGFVKLHIEDVPNRQGAEGMSHRIGLVRLKDHAVRYCLGNRGLAEVKLQSISPQSVLVLVNGKSRTIDIGKVDWGSLVEP